MVCYKKKEKMSSMQFWVSLLVPPIVKHLQPRLRRFFTLSEFNAETRIRVLNKQYPKSYNSFYNLWIISLLVPGIASLFLVMYFAQGLVPVEKYSAVAFIGIINMFGVWFIGGAILDFIFWQISPPNFRDYVIFRQIKTGWGFDIKEQIITLFRIGFVYYLVVIPIMLLILVLG